jgi:hypothetical protein
MGTSVLAGDMAGMRKPSCASQTPRVLLRFSLFLFILHSPFSSPISSFGLIISRLLAFILSFPSELLSFPGSISFSRFFFLPFLPYLRIPLFFFPLFLFGFFLSLLILSFS